MRIPKRLCSGILVIMLVISLFLAVPSFAATYYNIQQPKPAEFKNVTYKYKDNVVVLDDFAMERVDIDDDGVITIPNVNLTRDTILVDEGSKAVLNVDKIEGKNSFMQTTQPRIENILEDFNIPEQTVVLNPANIVNPSVEPSISYGKTSIFPSTHSSGSGSNMNIDFVFHDKDLTVCTSEGGKVKVTLDGKVSLIGMAIRGQYSFSGGYNFSLVTGEEVNISIESKFEFKQQVRIPITGFDIPCGIGNVYAGLFLVANIDGSFTLEVDIEQGVIAEAGVEGGTFFGIPTSVHPYFKHKEKFNIITDFTGKINGFVAITPAVGIRLLGEDIFNAEVRLGMALDVKSNPSRYLDVHVYGLLQTFVGILGKDITIFDKTFSLYHTYKPDTPGFKMNIQESCAYRDMVRGNIEKDSDKGFVPYNKEIIIHRYIQGDWNNYTTFGGICDASGNFEVNGVDMVKGDTVSIQVGDVISPDIPCTIPFSHINLNYADFFQDEAVGSVSKKVEGYSTDYEPIFMTYTGPVYLINGEMKDGKFIEKSMPIKGNCVKGDFKVSFDFKPEKAAIAYANIEGFELYSPVVDTDTGIKIWRTLGNTKKFEVFNEEGNFYESYIVYLDNNFRIINTRGYKQVNQAGDFKCSLVPLQLKWMDVPLFVIDGIKEFGYASYEVEINPVNYFTGESQAKLMWKYKWKKPEDTEHNESYEQEQPSKDLKLSTINLDIKTKDSDKDNNNWLDIQIEEKDKAVFDKKLSEKFDVSYDCIDNSSIPLARYYKMNFEFSFVYEGHKFTYTDEDEESDQDDPTHVLTKLNPVEHLMRERIDSKINPAPFENIFKPDDSFITDISNQMNIPTWSKASVIQMVENSIIDLNANNQFPVGQKVSRGEFSAFITRAFGIKTTNLTMPFTDINSSYRYRNEVMAAYQNGIINGMGDNTFNTEDNITREQAAAIIMRAFSIAKSDVYIKSDKEVLKFKDANTISSYATEVMLQMVQLGLYKGFEDNTIRPHENITFEQVAVLLDRSIQQ